MPAKKVSKNKNRNFSLFKSRRFLIILSTLVVAGIGSYLLFFAKAAVNNCSAVSGGQICDLNQVSSPDGTDALVSVNEEALNLARGGWTDWGVGFRAPTFPMNGAKPVHRFWYPDLSIHALVIEGSGDYNNYVNLKNQGKAQDEGVFFYAWPSVSQADTVPIQRINRKALYFLVLYTADPGALPYFLANGGGTYEDGGVNFYAFPANYVPPVPNGGTQATKDTDCANAGLRLGDKGACVQWLKGVMNTKFSTKFNTADNKFDDSLNANILFFVRGLKNAGVNVDAYSNVVTASIWNALVAGFPAAPPTAPSNASSGGKTTVAPTSGKSNGKPGTRSSGSGSTNANNPCDTPAEQQSAQCQMFFTALDNQIRSGDAVTTNLFGELFSGISDNNAAGKKSSSSSKVTKHTDKPCEGNQSFECRGANANKTVTTYSYSCVLRGEEVLYKTVTEKYGRQSREVTKPSGKTKSVTLKRNFSGYASESSAQKQGPKDCADWRTEQNRSARYKGLTIS
jgi:hypothetical protein